MLRPIFVLQGAGLRLKRGITGDDGCWRDNNNGRDNQIDQLGYQLYDLTEEETKIIENA
jgi:hypothetical protein